MEALKASIPVELSKLSFDYFRLHEQSITFLRRLRQTLDTDLKKHVGVPYIDNEIQLSTVGLYVILFASDTNAVTRQSRVSDGGSKILQKAGDALTSFVREDL